MDYEKTTTPVQDEQLPSEHKMKVRLGMDEVYIDYYRTKEAAFVAREKLFALGYYNYKGVYIPLHRIQHVWIEKS